MTENELVCRYIPLVRGLAKRAARHYRLDPMECESDAYLALLQAIRTFDPSKGALPARIRFRVRSALMDLQRRLAGTRRAKAPKVQLDPAITQDDSEQAPSFTPDETIDEQESAARLLNALPKPQRYVLWRCAVDGMTRQEVAQELGVSPATTGKLYKSGCARMRMQPPKSA